MARHRAEEKTAARRIAATTKLRNRAGAVSNTTVPEYDRLRSVVTHTPLPQARAECAELQRKVREVAGRPGSGRTVLRRTLPLGGLRLTVERGQTLMERL